MAERRDAGQRRAVFIDLDDHRPRLHGGERQLRRRKHCRGSADGEQQIAFARRGLGGRKCLRRQRFAEPHHVGPEVAAAARAARRPAAEFGASSSTTMPSSKHLLRWRLPCSSITAREPARACSPSTFWVTSVKLGNEPGQTGERPMGRVRLRLRNQPAPPLVPVPDELRVAPECLRRRELLRPEPGPQPGLCVTEGGHAALGGDAGAGKHDDAARAAKPLHHVAGRIRRS